MASDPIKQKVDLSSLSPDNYGKKLISKLENKKEIIVAGEGTGAEPFDFLLLKLKINPEKTSDIIVKLSPVFSTDTILFYIDPTKCDFNTPYEVSILIDVTEVLESNNWRYPNSWASPEIIFLKQIETVGENGETTTITDPNWGTTVTIPFSTGTSIYPIKGVVYRGKFLITSTPGRDFGTSLTAPEPAEDFDTGEPIYQEPN